MCVRKSYITKGIYSRSCNRNKMTEVLEALEAKMVRVVGLQANCNYFRKKKRKRKGFVRVITHNGYLDLSNPSRFADFSPS